MFLVVLTEIEAYILSYDAKNSVRKQRSEVIFVKKAIIFLLLSLILVGCRPVEEENVSAHIVKEITITCENCTSFTRRYYNTNSKMQKILLYLRSVSPGTASKEDPEELAGQVICITLRRVDGSTKLYRQKNDRYLQVGNDPWRKINPEWGVSLFQLIMENESDPETEPAGYHPLPGSWQYNRLVRRVTGKAI